MDSTLSSPSTTNICMMSGSVARALSPRHSEFVGTLRSGIRCSPSRSASSVMMVCILCCASASRGMNTSPVPYLPRSGTGMPCNKINSCGICSMMPAPSPSLPISAPRWRMFSNTRSASSTIW